MLRFCGLPLNTVSLNTVSLRHVALAMLGLETGRTALHERQSLHSGVEHNRVFVAL